MLSKNYSTTASLPQMSRYTTETSYDHMTVRTAVFDVLMN